MSQEGTDIHRRFHTEQTGIVFLNQLPRTCNQREFNFCVIRVQVMSSDFEEQEDELLALQSIFSPQEFGRNEPKFGGEIRVCVDVPAGFTVATKEGELLCQYEISFLPPLLLNFDLPEDYPSSSPPSFTLTCSWLSHTQISVLGAQLIDIYQATRGTVVLFTWVQFLKEDALRFLDIENLLELPSDDHTSKNCCHAANQQPDNHPAPDAGTSHNVSCNLSGHCEGDVSAPSDLSASAPSEPRAENASLSKSPGNSNSQEDDQSISPPFLSPSQRLVSQILINDATQQQKRFASTVFDCGVCFSGYLGSDSVKLPECGHIFCRGCLSEFCKVLITEGNVRGVTCPQADCSSAPTPAQVRTLVGEELFGRYDRLLLQNTLEHVVYCPRRDCGSAVIREKSSNAAMCSVCGFAFCVACRKTYHGAGSCRPETSLGSNAENESEEGKLPLPKSKEGLVALWEDYIGGGKERKRLLESRYGRSVMTLKLEGFLSESWVAVNTKYCPYCFSRIEKNGGCNVMTCCRCFRNFCWVCLTKLTERTNNHFENGTCSRSDIEQSTLSHVLRPPETIKNLQLSCARRQIYSCFCCWFFLYLNVLVSLPGKVIVPQGSAMLKHCLSS
ncbi:E3 ubiquitin-protein ligase RNF14-like isoform X2 [Takifugu flavidus]|uniref:E3 ubiquitin-protein ligase RNF14-like isoform X2 n=1 Tax=Takifugu flavidus TaxID=433684 RepID=UPI002544BB35|nr:E3 ubiquitin-protein ligase RNF14-like isoform X2 [Takifugu flavidus]